MRKYQKVILEKKEVYVGLEDSRRTWKVCVRFDKRTIHQTSMPTNLEGLLAYFNNHYPDCRIKVIYEAGFHGFWLHDFLVKNGIECIVTPPHTVTEEKLSAVKTDKKDALRLAKILENQDYKQCIVPSKAKRSLRQIHRTEQQIQRDIVARKNRIRKTLEFHGFDLQLDAGTWTEKKYLELENLVMDEDLDFCLFHNLNILKQLIASRDDLRKKMIEVAKEKYPKQFKSALSTPGIGKLTAARIILEVPDNLEVFSDKTWASWLGFAGREYSTGETRIQSGISKMGNKFIRHYLVESAWITIRKDPGLQNKFQRVRQNSGNANKAIVAVARKLAIRLRKIFITGEQYEICRA